MTYTCAKFESSHVVELIFRVYIDDEHGKTTRLGEDE